MAEKAARGDRFHSKSWLMISAAISSLVVAGILIAAKAIVWVMTGSVAILSSLVDSGLDAVASLVNFLAVRHALTPADKEHRFGHGKVEALAGLSQALIIAGSAFYLVYEAITRFLEPQPVSQGAAGIAVMLLSILLTMGLVSYQRFVIKRTDSIAISADSLHYVSDLLMNLGVIAALVLSAYLGVGWADPAFALATAAFILTSSRKIFAQSMDIVLDRELADADRRRISEMVYKHPEVISMHDLRTRSSGVGTFIQFHIELDPGMTISHAHEIMDDLEAAVHHEFPNAEVLIHTDPYGIQEPQDVFE